MAFIFDTNIFIRSKNEMPMDLWPTFWQRMKEIINSGKVFSSITVKEEIDRGNDEITSWLKVNAPKNFYLPIDDEVIVKYAYLQNWARQNSLYSPKALLDFSTVADAYVIATAAAKSVTIVTNEKSAPLSKRSVKIPDVCIAIGVSYCDLNTALRSLNITI